METADELCRVIHERDIRRLKEMLNEGVDPNSFSGGYTNRPLHLALSLRDPEMVQVLLDTGKIDVNARGDWRGAYTPTMLACLANYPEILRRLLKYPDVDVNVVNFNVEAQALSYAMMYGHTDCLKLLFKSGKLDTEGYNPLAIAMAKGDSKQLRQLLRTKKGRQHINKHCHDTYLPYPPLIQAVILKKPEYIRMLLNCTELNVQLTDHFYAENNVEGDEVLEYGSCAPALFHAIGSNETEIVKLLLADKRVDVLCKDEIGNTPLHHAIRFEQANMVNLLLATKKMDLNIKNNEGLTPLQLLTEKILADIKQSKRNENFVQMARALLHQEGLDVSEHTKELIICHAVCGTTDSFEKQLQKNAGNVADNAQLYLFCAAYGSNKDCMRFLLSLNGVQVNTPDASGKTVLHYAAEIGDKKMVTFLLNVEGIDINAVDKAGYSVLFTAAMKGHAAVIEQLLETEGINLLDIKNTGFTLLHAAAQGSSGPVLDKIIALKGMDINGQDNDGNTPLHIAAASENDIAVKQLLGYKSIQPNLKNKAGETALDVAKLHGSRKCVELLEDKAP